MLPLAAEASFLPAPLHEGKPALLLLALPLVLFLLTPLCAGQSPVRPGRVFLPDFYSRPCVRGDGNFSQNRHAVLQQIAEG